MPRRVKVKRSHFSYQLELRVQQLNHLFKLQEKQGYISLYVLKRVQEEAEDFQKFLQYHGYTNHWTDFLDQ